MPYYLYQCANCQHEELRNYSITKSPKIVTCGKCGKESLTRCIGRGGMIKMDGVKFFQEGGDHKKCTI